MVISKKALQVIVHSIFEKTKLINECGQEYWTARQLSKILRYSSYRNFISVIDKSKEACGNSNHDVNDHFVDFNNMVETGSGAKRSVNDVKLSRYACYLIVQNADPEKEIVAIGQTYFAIQTRKQELQAQAEYNALKTEQEKRLFLREELKKHNKQLAGTAKGAGVIAPVDYAIFQDHGYKGLYNGMGAKDIHTKKLLNKNQNILDHMGSTELAANLFRATQTEDKLRRDNIRNKQGANITHYNVGVKVRKTIKELGGTMPEELPAVESIKNKRTKKLSKKKE